MEAIWTVLQRKRWWPVWAGLLAALVLLPMVWSFGFWDPQEIAIADKARAFADGAAMAEAAVREPPFTVWAIGTSIDWLGPSELNARLPLVLLGIITVLATCLLGARLDTPRAGLFSGVIMLASPMLVLESRQLMSAVGVGAGGAVLMLGLVGALWPATPRTGSARALYLGDAALVALGATIGYFAGGALVGLFVPLAAVAGAGVLAIGYRPDADQPTADRRSLVQLYAGSGALLIATIAVLVWVVAAVFDVVEASPGDRAIFGKTLRAGRDYVAAIGGTWRSEVPISITWDGMFEQIAYGAFPWIALAPFALGRAAMSRGSQRRTWAGHVVFLWAFLAWLVGTLLTLKAGPVRYAAFPALALAVGSWLDDLLASRDGERDGATALPTRLPMAALAVLLIAVMLGKDLKAFPTEFAAMHMLDGSMQFPKDAAGWLKATPLLFGVLIGFSLWVGIWRPGAMERPVLGAVGATPWQRFTNNAIHLFRVGGFHVAKWFAFLGQRGVRAALVLGVVFAMFLSFVYTPSLARKFSYKHLFDRYRDLRGADTERLGILGMPGSGPEYYARGDYEKLKNRNELFAFLGRDQRVFAMGPRKDLCAIHQGASTNGFDYFVLDTSHAQFMLLSNQLGDGQADDNPLKRAIVRELPTSIKYPLSAVFDDKIELIGATMPAEVGRGEMFEITLFYKVLTKPRRNWQIFLHFDGAGMRFQGDHWPVDNQCGTNYWQPGDYIIDTYRMSAGDLTTPRRTYDIWTGFFVGSSGNWTNMKATTGNPDGNNRVPVGKIKVK